jgi:hypothetical protein
VLCCLVGGLLAAALLGAARRRRAHNPTLALAFGFGAGALVVELVTAALVPLGGVSAPGALWARLAVLVVPAVMAVAAGLAGAGGSLLVRQGVMTVATAAAAGALVAEVVDLHLVRLHANIGLAAGVAIHVPAFLFLAGGLRWRAKLSRASAAAPSCGCEEQTLTAL